MARWQKSAQEKVEVKVEPEKVEPVLTEPEIEIEIEDSGQEPAPIVVKTEDDPEKTEMRKRLDALEGAERRAQEAEATLARQQAAQEATARKYQEEHRKLQDDAAQSQYDSVVNALSAAQTELESAKRELQSAGMEQDWARIAEANDRIGRSAGDVRDLERAKIQLENYREAAAKAPAEQVQVTQDPIEAMLAQAPLPPKGKDWIRAHPEFWTDPRKNAKIQALHWDAIEAGHEAFSPKYFEFLEVEAGIKARHQEDRSEAEPQVQLQRKTNVPAAPVSRDNPSLSTGKTTPTKVTLTLEEKEVARSIATSRGITEHEAQIEYARNKIKLDGLKKQGHYQ